MTEIESRAPSAQILSPHLPEPHREALEQDLCEIVAGLNLLTALDDELAIDAESVRWAATRLAEQARVALGRLDRATWRATQ